MKKVFFLTLIVNIIFSTSCSHDDNIDNIQENVSIEFKISSTSSNRLSEIMTIVTNGVDENGISKLDLKNESNSNIHLPYSKDYINQTVYHNTSLGIHYRDNSGVSIGSTFENYSITMTILVDGVIVSEKEVEITEAGMVGNLDYSFSLI